MAEANAYESPWAYAFKRQLFAAFIGAVFFSLSIVGVLHHEPFRDELQAWMIAADSPSLASMFRTLRYEGHPGLWYVCLFVISRLTRNLLGMQFFHICISTAAVFIFARYSPFSRLQIALFSFSYFPFFEYNLISRNYSFGLLFCALFCSLFPYRQRGYLCLLICLALLANTNVYGLILSLVLATILIVEGISTGLFQRFLRLKPSMLVASLITFGMGVLISLIQIVPPADAKFQVAPKIFAGTSQFAIAGDVRHFFFAIMRVWAAYFPVPNVLKTSLWGSNILLDSSGKLKIIAFALSIAIVIIGAILFSKSVPILVGYLLGTAGMIYFIYDRYFGELRHHGHLFILFVLCAWLYAYTQPPMGRSPQQFQPKFSRPRLLSFSLTGILAVQAVVGVSMYAMDVVRPFTASKAAAAYVVEHKMGDRFIVGSEERIVESIAGLLDRPMYYPELKRLGTFIPWNETTRVTQDEVLAQTAQRLNGETPSVLLILSEPLAKSHPDLAIKPLASFPEAMVPYEDYYLYDVTRRSP